MTQNHGLFVGVTTLDCIYQADHPPAANEKVVAAKSLIVAGGPATNAAVAFAQLMRSNQATLHSVIGAHALTGLIKEDLLTQGVTLADLAPERLAPPAVSSIVVSAETGDRAVISRSAADAQVDADAVSPDILSGVSIVLIDGHQMAASAQIAQWAKERDIPIVIDAGSWKPGFESVLPFADAVIASANFFPPECETTDAVIRYLLDLGITKLAITRGAKPILFIEGDNTAEMEVPKVRAVDTLGAGDIFHGAFCHFYLTHTFEESLLKASRTASFACQHWGTRDWTKIYRIDIDDDDDEERTN
ncbi:MAG: PfkB family carbohydrate kinase [Cyanobacteria bacterium J06627_28]